MLEVRRPERSVQVTSKQACTCPGTEVTHLVEEDQAHARQSRKRGLHRIYLSPNPYSSRLLWPRHRPK